MRFAKVKVNKNVGANDSSINLLTVRSDPQLKSRGAAG